MKIIGAPAFLLLVLGCLAPGNDGQAVAHPARIIILRHAEKRDGSRLCRIGLARADALAAQYLGRQAPGTALLRSTPPAAFYSVTFHTLETLAPSAASWGMSQRIYTAMPPLADADKNAALNQATQNAVRDIMSDPSFAGRTVVIAWEHQHIADPRMEARYPGQSVTLRQLLHLASLPGVPERWASKNFDFFWVVDYADSHSEAPTGFRMVMQRFAGNDAVLPENAWGVADGLPSNRCRGDLDAED